jgi:hypothetical protein
MSQISKDFKNYMRGEASFESAVAVPSELSTDLPLESSDVLEIREDRADVDAVLEAMIEPEPQDGQAIASSAAMVGEIVTTAPTIDPVAADAYVPIANASLESFSRILDIAVPKLHQELNGQISVESIDSLRDWVGQASSSFRASVKNFFGRIALWWRRAFVTLENLRKRLNNIRARQGSRKGTGGKDLKLGKYAANLVQGDGYCADPLAAMSTEAALCIKLSQILLAAQSSVEATLTSRLDQLLATDRPASAMFRADMSKVIADLEAAVKSQPSHLLGNSHLVTQDDDEDDFILLAYISATPDAATVAKNGGALRSLSPEQVTTYLDAIDTILDTAMATIRGIEKESARICKIADQAVDRVASKYVTSRDLERQSVDAEGRPVVVVETETTSSIGRVMDTEYEIVEVINGLSWTINTVMARLMYVASGVLTLAEESVIQD